MRSQGRAKSHGGRKESRCCWEEGDTTPYSSPSTITSKKNPPSLSANTFEGDNPQGGGDNGPKFLRCSNHGSFSPWSCVETPQSVGKAWNPTFGNSGANRSSRAPKDMQGMNDGKHTTIRKGQDPSAMDI